MNIIDSNKNKKYIEQIFNARLSKSEKPVCPNCGASAQESFKPSEYDKIWKCRCFQSVAPLSGTIFAKSQIPIEKLLHAIRLILETPDIQAKLIHYELGISMPASYRSIDRVKSWQAENNIHKSRRKRKIKPRYRTGLHLINEMVLKTVPPLFNQKPISINFQNHHNNERNK